MAANASGGVGLFAIAWLATRRLSGPELGYLFSFLSFGALAQLADFGISYAALQAAGRLAGTDRLAELPSLARRVHRWNVVASPAVATVVAGIGWKTFTSASSTVAGPDVSWSAAWIAYVVAVLLVQLAAPGIAVREGAGKVAEAWRVRLVQEWAAAAACLSVLHFGGRLWCLPAFALARAAVATVWLRWRFRLTMPADAPVFTARRWRDEVWPFQWKIGLSALSGFLIFRAFAPLILLEKGPVMAGQFGLAISIMNLMIAISSAWPMSQAARYSTWIAGGRYSELRRDFPTLLWSSTALAALAAVGMALGLWWARLNGFVFALRLPSLTTTTVILAAAVLHHTVFCIAVFLRADGREPFLVPSVVGAAVTVVTIWLTARYGTLLTIAVAYLLCTIVGLGIAFLLLRARCRQPSLAGSEEAAAL